jgi:hypothetical protein
MKRVLAVAFALASVVCVIVFVIRLSKNTTVSQTAQVPPPEQAQPHREPMKSNDLSNSIKTTSSSDAAATPVPVAQHMPPELEGATKDPAVVEFWSSHKPQEIGEVRPTNNAQTKQLWVNGRMAFEAATIKNVRTKSLDGTIALAAVAAEPTTTGSKDDVEMADKPSRIWLVDPQGNRRPISPPGIDASKPLIAPDGNLVAFTGSQVSGGTPPPGDQLFVVDLKSGASRTFSANQRLDDYNVTAVEWADGGKALKVIEDHGETGGHMVMRQIRLE